MIRYKMSIVQRRLIIAVAFSLILSACESGSGVKGIDGLKWIAMDGGSMLNWYAANTVCSNLRADGFTWTLPTFDELIAIQQGETRYGRPISGNIIPIGSWSWSASGDPRHPEEGYFVSKTTPFTGTRDPYRNIGFFPPGEFLPPEGFANPHVICVHGGK